MDDESIDSGDENPSEDEVQFCDDNVSPKASKITTIQAHKKPKLGGLSDMFDVKGREGVDLAIARFFLHVAFLSMQPTHHILSKWSVQLIMDLWGISHLVMRRQCHH